MKLGIFDSGLGGLTVLRRVREQLPNADILYFADQAHVPYGDKTPEELRAYLAYAVTYLEGQGVDAIVMGCNTSCAIAAQFGYPPTSVPILDLIDAAAHAVAASGASHVGVLATAATIRSGAYGRAIRRLAPRIEVQEVAAPALVPLVESGQRRGPRVREAVAQACSRFKGELELLVLACTHYPLLDAEFANVLGDGVLRVDPALAQAERVVALGMRTGCGATRYVTTGDIVRFRANLEEIVGAPLALDDVKKAEENVRRDEPKERSGQDLQGRVGAKVDA